MSSLPPAPVCEASGIYCQILGDEFEKIGSPLREFLKEMGELAAVGTFNVRRRGGLPGMFLGTFLGFPQSGECVPLTLKVQRTAAWETWNRDFSGRPLVSHHTREASYLVEKLGPVKIYHTLTVDGGALLHEAYRTTICGMRVPRVLAPKVTAVGTPGDLGWDVSVKVNFPLIGTILSYDGKVAVVK